MAPSLRSGVSPRPGVPASLARCRWADSITNLHHNPPRAEGRVSNQGDNTPAELFMAAVRALETPIVHASIDIGAALGGSVTVSSAGC